MKQLTVVQYTGAETAEDSQTAASQTHQATPTVERSTGKGLTEKLRIQGSQTVAHFKTEVQYTGLEATEP